MTLTFLWVALAALACPSAAIKVLMLPALFKSHLNYFVPISTALSEAGHEVYVVLSEAYPVPAGLKEGGAKVLTYKSPTGVCFLATEEFAQNVIDNTLANHGDPKQLGAVVAPYMSQECDLLLTDEDLYRKAADIKPDVSLVDGLFFSRCLYMFAARLGVPYVTITTLQEPWHTRQPALPSFVPFLYAGLTDRMSLSERLFNTFINVMWVNSRISAPPSEKVTKMYPPDIVRDFNYLITRSAMWFYNSDIVMNYPQPMMPNVVDIGGVCIRPPKQLPKDLQKFMDDAKEGVIIVSFGSVLPDLPPEISKKFISAFRKLRQSVIWRMSKPESLDLPPNIRTLKWLPQQDVLAHQNSKLMITHCGNNGQFEAMNYKVPMIGFPIFGDQMFNAKRIEYKGYGKWLDIHTFTSEQLLETILSILNNQSFSENLKRASQIFRDRPDNPRARAVYWLEHVAKYGQAHMRASAMDLPWYTYLMLDVFAIFFTIFITLVLVVCACVCFALRLCRQLATSEKVKTT